MLVFVFQSAFSHKKNERLANMKKRIASIIGIILILSLYIVSLVSAIFAKEVKGLFAASVFCAIVLPIMIWWFITVYKWVHKKDNNNDDMSDKQSDKQA